MTLRAPPGADVHRGPDRDRGPAAVLPPELRGGAGAGAGLPGSPRLTAGATAL